MLQSFFIFKFSFHETKYLMMKKYKKIIIPLSILGSSALAVARHTNNLTAAFGFLLGCYIIGVLLTLLVGLINKSVFKEFISVSLFTMLIISIISFIGWVSMQG